MAAARWLLTPLLGHQFPFITFFPAVFLAAWLGGFGPALFATIASTVLAIVLVFPPLSNILLPQAGTIGIALFLLMGAMTALLGGSRVRAQARRDALARQATEAAERLVEEAAQQRDTEAALRASEARFRAMAQSSPLGIFITEPAGD